MFAPMKHALTTERPRTKLFTAIVRSGKSIRQVAFACQPPMNPGQMAGYVNGLVPTESVKQRIAHALGKSIADLWA